LGNWADAWHLASDDAMDNCRTATLVDNCRTATLVDNCRTATLVDLVFMDCFYLNILFLSFSVISVYLILFMFFKNNKRSVESLSNSIKVDLLKLIHKEISENIRQEIYIHERGIIKKELMVELDLNNVLSDQVMKNVDDIKVMTLSVPPFDGDLNENH